MRFTRDKLIAAFMPLLLALMLSHGALLPARVFAATPAGDLITHTIAGIRGNVSGQTVSINSNVLSPTVVQPVYGLELFGEEASSSQSFSDGGSVEFRFSVINNGNDWDTIFIDVTGIQYAKEDPLAVPVWNIWVCETSSVNCPGLTWQGSNATSISPARTADTASVTALAGETKVFYIVVSAPSGAREGARVSFNVSLRSSAATASSYTGFNGVVYGGSSSFTASPTYTAESLDSQAPQLSFDLVKTGTELTGKAKIYGTAKDAHFTGYKLYYGPGSNPSTWRQIANVSGATTYTNALLAEWDTATAGLQGAYTLKLESTDGAGNTSTGTYSFAVGNMKKDATGTVTAGQWTMMSIPGIPKSSTIAGIFGSTTRYEIQQWNPSIAQDDPYIKKYARDFSIEVPGEAFWIKAYDQNLLYTYDMTNTDTTQLQRMQLKKGWNQIGYPYDRASGTLWQDVQVESSTGTVKTMSAAITAGWVDASLWEYNGAGYTQLTTASSIYPRMGYFLQVYEDVKLVFDPGYHMPGGLARIVKPQFDWKLSLAARTVSANDTENYVGQARGASSMKDPMDLGEPPTVEPYVSLYFDNREWGRWSGRYAADARPPGDDVKTWTFSVETSDEGSGVTLTMPDGDALPENYTFVITDKKTGQSFDPKTVSQYEYVDDGSGLRQFEIVATKRHELGAVTLSHEFPAGWSLMAVPLETDPTDARAQLSDDLININMFQYYNGQMYGPDSAEKVDIQSGIGYWLHLESAKALDFSGMAIDETTPVVSPLEKGWNLIGNPYRIGILYGNQIEVVRGSERLSLEQAVGAGWIDGNIYGYRTEGGGYERLTIGSAMEPWRGYAIMAKEKCELIFRTEP